MGQCMGGKKSQTLKPQLKYLEKENIQVVQNKDSQNLLLSMMKNQSNLNTYPTSNINMRQYLSPRNQRNADDKIQEIIDRDPKIKKVYNYVNEKLSKKHNNLNINK